MTGMMIGPGIRTVFTSRWKALWWSAGILATAYCAVPSENREDGAEGLARSYLTRPASDTPSGGSPSQDDNPWK